MRCVGSAVCSVGEFGHDLMWGTSVIQGAWTGPHDSSIWLEAQTPEPDCPGLNPDVPLNSHVTSGNLLKSVPQFTSLQNELKISTSF